MQPYTGFSVCLWGLFTALLLGCPGAWAKAPPRPGEPLAQVFSEFFQDSDRTTRLEACFFSAGLAERPEHLRLLRNNLKTADPVERVATLYAPAVMTRAPDDVDAFLAAFPVGGEVFTALTDAEWDLSATLGTGMADFLLLLVHEPHTRDRALPHLARIIYNRGPVEILTFEAQDPLVKAYLDAHGPALAVEDWERIWYRGRGRVEAKLQELMLSDDPVSCTAAFLIHRRDIDPKRFPAVLKKFQQKNIPLSKAQYVLLQKALDYTAFLENFPTDRASVEQILRTEQEIYRPPFKGVVSTFLQYTEPFSQGPLKAFRRYGGQWLEACEKYYLSRRVKE